MTIKHLKLDEVRIDGGTQARAEIDTDVVAEYAALLKSGKSMPPVDTFFDGSHYWLAEGFHRWHGHKQAGLLLISSEVRQGTVRDAILFAVGANQGHGLRRSHKDKRKAVKILLDDPEWVNFSDRKIAELVGVHHDFVGTVRAQVAVDDTTLAAQTKDQPRIGKDGKRQSARKKPGTKKPPRKISGGTTFDVGEIEAASEPLADFQAPYDAILNHLKQIRQQFNQLAEDPRHGVYLVEKRTRIQKAIDEVRDPLAMARPERLCGECEGNGCHKCRQTGWWTKAFVQSFKK